jgi:hypothetical protein
MEQVKFGIRFTVNEYADRELSHFIDCADSIIDEDNIQKRYVDFLTSLMEGKVKPSTPVDIDVLFLFGGDLENRASIDYLEGHWDDEPEIVAGGKMFYGRYEKLKELHAGVIKWQY